MERRANAAALLTLVIALGQPAAALAHAGAPLAPHDLWTAWNVSPLLLGGIAALAWLYGCGVANAWQARGHGRVAPVWRVWAFAAGVLMLVGALISPLDALAGALFSAHMVQHLILVLAAAPLLVLGAPPLPLLWALPPGWRPRATRWSRTSPARAARRVAAAPLAALALHVSTLWLWHLPPLYDAALQNEAIHALEHATLLGSALLFWWAVIQPVGKPHAGGATGVLLTFAASLQGTVLGALIAFTSVVWYRPYAGSTGAWGLSPLDDQRLAGLIMMMPAGTVYLVAALLLLARLLRAPEPPGARIAVAREPAAIRLSEPGVR